MGLFGGGGDDDNGANDALNRQIAENEQEVEYKRQNLFKQKLDVIKSQGNEVWTPDRSSGVSQPSAPQIPGGFPFGKMN